MTPDLFAAVKKDFFDIFGKLSQWQWGKDLSRTLHDHFLLYCQAHSEGKRYLSKSEAREILQKTDETGRVNVLFRLSQESTWESFQKKFLLQIWPRELKFKSPRVTSALVKIVLNCEENFPDAVKTVLPFMAPITQGDLSFYTTDGTVIRIAKQFPAEMLALLSAVIGEGTVAAPYQTSNILDEIEQSNSVLSSDPRIRRIREHLNRYPY